MNALFSRQKWLKVAENIVVITLTPVWSFLNTIYHGNNYIHTYIGDFYSERILSQSLYVCLYKNTRHDALLTADILHFVGNNITVGLGPSSVPGRWM
jgi:hypothetical protein